LSKDSVRLRNLLLRLSKGYLALEKAMMSECCKLNASSAYILEALGRLGTTTPGELADELGLAPSTVTRQLDAVAAEGLIERSSKETDRRVQQLSLTSAGRQMLSTLQTGSQEVTERLIRRIPDGATPLVFDALSLLVRAVAEELGTELEGSIVDEKAVRDKVKEKYSRLATSAGGCCCQSQPAECTSKGPISSDLYSEEAEALPTEALNISLGCGNPTALARLKEGEHVLDLGCGGGIDVLLAARKVGPSGRVIGLDMTDEMLDLARSNAKKAGLSNVEFKKGLMESIPLADNSVDVIISNCVINLSTDKKQVLNEAFRVLRPGGRFNVSDVVHSGDVPEALRQNLDLWAGCVAGSLSAEEYVELLKEAGFVDVAVIPTRVYGADAVSCCSEHLLPLSPEDIKALDGKFFAAFIEARKPE